MNKIDFVITYVDGLDENWLKQKEKALKVFSENRPYVSKISHNKNRYRDWGTLKYWFRGVEKFAPWVNKIYFITCGQIPTWLNIKNDKLVLIDHKDYIPKKYLPTFNSDVIEMNLHRIKELSENFVCFNDDMFLINNVNPEDFFINDKPCDTAVQGIVPMTLDTNYTDFNNIKILNKYFNKREVIKKNWNKWFNIKYGKDIIKNILLLPWKNFTGMTEYHICYSLKKSVLNELWNLEPLQLDKTSRSQFRDYVDLNVWLVKNFQICSGNFVPRNPKIGKSFFKEIDEEIIKEIVNQKHKVVCINDHIEISEEEFQKQKKELLKAFEKILPEKSKFEK